MSALDHGLRSDDGWGWVWVLVSKAVRAAATVLMTGLWCHGVKYTKGHTPREKLLQGFAFVARGSVGASWCAEEIGCGGNMRNTRPETPQPWMAPKGPPVFGILLY